MGSLMFADVTEFFGKYLKDRKLTNYEIVITGKDIITDIQTKDGYTSTYESRYQNVDFIPSIFPPPQIEELYWGTRDPGRERFRQAYFDHLSKDEPMSDLCSIVDLVINKDVNVIMMCSHREYAIEFFEYMREFIFENFKLYMISCGECMVDPGLLEQYGDKDEIRKMLSFHAKRLNPIIDETGDWINRFTDDAADKYKEILMKKSIDELYDLGQDHAIHVNRYKPKEDIVEHILKRLMSK